MNIRRSLVLRLTIRLLAVVAACHLSLRAEDLATKSGEKIAFLGDSITAAGVGSTGGYVRLVIKALELEGQKIEMIPAGVSGNTSRDMLARLDASVLSKKPDWLTVSCGVNDVWHGANGVELEPYKKNITAIVDQAQAAGIKVMLLTATMIHEDAGNPANTKLAAYNAFLQELATEKHTLIADLNTDMQAIVKADAARMPGNILTVDGVHMNALGNQVMAVGILKAFGFTAAQIDKARAVWNDIPDAAQVNVRANLTAAQFRQLRELAAAQKKTVEDFLSQDVAKAIEPLLASPGK